MLQGQMETLKAGFCRTDVMQFKPVQEAYNSRDLLNALSPYTLMSFKAQHPNRRSHAFGLRGCL